MRLIFLSLIAGVAFGQGIDQGVPTFETGTLKGSLIVSPVDIRPLEIKLLAMKNCKTEELSYYRTRTCELDGLIGTVTNGNEKADLTFKKSTTFVKKKPTPEEVVSFSQIFSGIWTMGQNGETLVVPVALSLDNELKSYDHLRGVLKIGATEVQVRARLE